jgi:UDP-N-acetylglucosamine acyltransferase
MSSSRIHPTAIIDSAAQLHESVEVGPYSVIGPGVTVGEGTRIGPHVVLKGPMTIGCDNRIFQFASIGEVSQDLTARDGDDTRVEIGNGNLIREFVSIQRGTLKDTGVTRIGDHNLFMNYVHVGHDCVFGNRGVFANGTQFGGHITVEDWVVLGGGTLVAQRCRLGAHSFAAGGAGITRDIPPFVLVQGNPAEPRGINLEGIRRRGFTAEDIAEIKQAYKLLYISDAPFAEAKAQLAQFAQSSNCARLMSDFVAKAKQLLPR